MKKIEKQVLALLDEPRSNAEIVRHTGLAAGVVAGALRKLRRRGLIVSFGATTARRHMRLATAIGALTERINELEERLARLEEPQQDLDLI